jgi:predicted HicB family RNase H-like nuclease
MKHLNYKGYTGSIEYSREDDLFFGKVPGIRSLISYEGKTF